MSEEKQSTEGSIYEPSILVSPHTLSVAISGLIDYALPRQTGITLFAQNIISQHLKDLPIFGLEWIERSLKLAVERNTIPDIEICHWEESLSLIQEELKERNTEENHSYLR